MLKQIMAFMPLLFILQKISEQGYQKKALLKFTPLALLSLSIKHCLANQLTHLSCPTFAL
ncbi:hypothetical protein KAR91_08515 [Candidatus Pacearchaeota archaeon]|nr:hypothetical protein [Candidatus Pacearchaeota archaeon]